MDWTELDRDRYRTTVDDHQVLTYRTPGRRRGWTVEIDGVADEGLTAVSPRAPSGWPGVRSMVEAVVRARLSGGGMGPNAWAGVG